MKISSRLVDANAMTLVIKISIHSFSVSDSLLSTGLSANIAYRVNTPGSFHIGLTVVSICFHSKVLVEICVPFSVIDCYFWKRENRPGHDGLSLVQL